MGEKKKKKAIVLLSGGMDSAVLLFLVKKQNYSINTLVFDYSQKHRKEITAAANLSSLVGADHLYLKLNLPWSNSSLISPKKRVPKKKTPGVPSTYVSARNIIFLSYAVSYAENVKANSIFIGAHTLDYSGYPDCRKNFLDAFAKAINLGIAGDRVNIRYPFLKKGKREIIEMGMKLGVPFELTWSCYLGGRKPCLKCDSCRFRTRAFSQLGIKDPLFKK